MPDELLGQRSGWCEVRQAGQLRDLRGSDLPGRRGREYEHVVLLGESCCQERRVRLGASPALGRKHVYDDRDTHSSPGIGPRISQKLQVRTVDDRRGTSEEVSEGPRGE